MISECRKSVTVEECDLDDLEIQLPAVPNEVDSLEENFNAKEKTSAFKPSHSIL